MEHEAVGPAPLDRRTEEENATCISGNISYIQHMFCKLVSRYRLAVKQERGNEQIEK